MPFLPSDVERSNPALAQEFEIVTAQLRNLTQQIALVDRVHSIKVSLPQADALFAGMAWNSCSLALDCNWALHSH